MWSDAVAVISIALPLFLLPVLAFWLLGGVSDGASLLSLLAGRRADAGIRSDGDGERRRILFLVPAHDEALLIEGCVASLLAMRREQSDYDVVVIADNCADATASLASDAGATVLERHDPARRGKPFALEWAFGRVALEKYDAFVIIDADAVVDAGFSDAIAALPDLRNVGFQGYNDIRNEGQTWLTVLAGVLIRARYEGQLPLKRAAGLNSPFTGCGMGVGTELFARRGWTDFSLTENWDLYVRYTLAHETIEFCPRARSFAQEAPTIGSGAVQRRRWHAGRWSLLRKHFPAIVGSGNMPWRQRADLLAELSAPGPVLHASVALMLALLLVAMPGSLAAVVGGGFVLSMLPSVGWTLVGIRRSRNRKAVAGAFLRLPLYAAWRAGLAARSLVSGRMSWQRSPRHPESGA